MISKIKEVYKELFYVPKHDKIKEKTFMAHIALSVFLVIFCLAVMGATAYAYFTAEVSSHGSTIASANYTVTVQKIDDGQLNDLTVPYKDYTVTTPGDSHTYLLSASGTATTGYCKIVINGTDAFYTEIIESGESMSITIIAATSSTIEFIPEWGTPAATWSRRNIYGDGDTINHSTTPYALYCVERNALLSDIAAYYGVYEADILTFNDITDITVGQTLKIPGVDPETEAYSVPLPDPSTVTLEEGQSLFALSVPLYKFYAVCTPHIGEGLTVTVSGTSATVVSETASFDLLLAENYELNSFTVEIGTSVYTVDTLTGTISDGTENPVTGIVYSYNEETGVGTVSIAAALLEESGAFSIRAIPTKLQFTVAIFKQDMDYVLINNSASDCIVAVDYGATFVTVLLSSSDGTALPQDIKVSVNGVLIEDSNVSYDSTVGTVTLSAGLLKCDGTDSIVLTAIYATVDDPQQSETSQEPSTDTSGSETNIITMPAEVPSPTANQYVFALVEGGSTEGFYAVGTLAVDAGALLTTDAATAIAPIDYAKFTVSLVNGYIWDTFVIQIGDAFYTCSCSDGSVTDINLNPITEITYSSATGDVSIPASMLKEIKAFTIFAEPKYNLFDVTVNVSLDNAMLEGMVSGRIFTLNKGDYLSVTLVPTGEDPLPEALSVTIGGTVITDGVEYDRERGILTVNSNLLIDGAIVNIVNYVAPEESESIEKTGEDGLFNYIVLEDGQIQITGYIGTEVEVVIPAKYDGYTVYSVGNHEAADDEAARYNIFGVENSTTNTTVTKITLNEGIVVIGPSAFHGCTGLTSVIEIPTTVTEIGDYAFEGINAEFIPSSDDNTEDPVVNEGNGNTEEPVVDEGNDDTEEPVVDEGNGNTEKPVVDEDNDDTEEPVVDEGNDDTDDPVVDEGNDDTDDPVVDEGNDDTDDPVVGEGNGNVDEVNKTKADGETIETENETN